MAEKNSGIVAKFILIVSAISLSLLFVLTVVVLFTASRAQIKQKDGFVAGFQLEQKHQTELLTTELRRKGDAMASLLAQTGVGLIIAYDFDGLTKLAGNITKDTDIVSVVFSSPDGNMLAEAKGQGESKETIRKEILSDGQSIGFVDIGLSFACIQKTLGEVARRTDEKVASTSKEMVVALWGMGIIVAVAAGIIVLVLCGAVYWALGRFVIQPVTSIAAGLNDSAAQVSAASGQLSGSAQQLSDGASEGAASLEETSASLEEISTMAQRNADNANECNTLMVEVNAVVEKANRSMQAQTTAMGEISKASDQTSKIVKTIDEIAFQTNLLALNAAVEAARAGEAGAGFAVVADEVRNLALRAAEAARNTATLIEGTVTKVKEGEGLLAQTNANFSGVADMAAKVGTLVGEIAVASKEQTQGLGQINKAIADIDRVTQQNAASSEETASSSAELRNQAELLQHLVEELVALVGSGGTRQHFESKPQQNLLS